VFAVKVGELTQQVDDICNALEEVPFEMSKYNDSPVLPVRRAGAGGEFAVPGELGAGKQHHRAGRSKPYITQLVALPDGSVQKYRKTHLGRSEIPHFIPGNELPVFNTARARFAVQICWDLHFPEVSTILSLKGAEIIFAPHASPSIVGDRKEI